LRTLRYDLSWNFLESLHRRQWFWCLAWCTALVSILAQLQLGWFFLFFSFSLHSRRCSFWTDCSRFNNNSVELGLTKEPIIYIRGGIWLVTQTILNSCHLISGIKQGFKNRYRSKTVWHRFDQSPWKLAQIRFSNLKERKMVWNGKSVSITDLSVSNKLVLVHPY
jgi:hypothetical protein